MNKTNDEHYILESERFIFDFLEIDEKILHIEGRFVTCSSASVEELLLRINNDIEKLDIVHRYTKSLTQANRRSLDFIGFSIRIEIDASDTLYEIQTEDATRIYYGRFFPVNSDRLPQKYYKHGWELKVTSHTLILKKCNLAARIIGELGVLCKFLASGQAGSKVAVAMKLLCYIACPFVCKDILLISDLYCHADDNGEALFRYVQQIGDKSIKYVFCIDKDCADFRRMKQYGHVIHISSWLCRFYIYLGASIASSHYTTIQTMMTGILRELKCENKMILLQHGITYRDHSSTWNRYNYGLSMLIAGTTTDYKAMLSYDYFYDERHIKLTGLPRYDLLYEDSKRYVTVMPTWRMGLVHINADKYDEWTPMPYFENSQYCLFFNELLTNTRLLSKAEEMGYTICFAPHPIIRGCCMQYFTKEEGVRYWSENTPYKEIFAQSDLIVTDYSSVFFDFAYLRKPLIYCQFDLEYFLGEGHYPQELGSFNFESDGFGEVENTLDGTVDRIIEYMGNGCKLKDKYRTRIESTFPFNDKLNCERVYRAIRTLK